MPKQRRTAPPRVDEADEREREKPPAEVQGNVAPEHAEVLETERADLLAIRQNLRRDSDGVEQSPSAVVSSQQQVSKTPEIVDVAPAQLRIEVRGTGYVAERQEPDGNGDGTIGKRP